MSDTQAVVIEKGHKHFEVWGCCGDRSCTSRHALRGTFEYKSDASRFAASLNNRGDDE
jgi:hypothetical protein